MPVFIDIEGLNGYNISRRCPSPKSDRADLNIR